MHEDLETAAQPLDFTYSIDQYFSLEITFLKTSFFFHFEHFLQQN